MKRLVVGFLFSPTGEEVVLIKKNRPKWQEGKYNGVGGHCNENEGAHEAMVREFKEETGLEVIDWQMFAKGYNHLDKEIEVIFFRAKSDFYDRVTTKEDEFVTVIPVVTLKVFPLIYNLSWLIPLALDKQTIYTVFNFILNNEIQP